MREAKKHNPSSIHYIPLEGGNFFDVISPKNKPISATEEKKSAYLRFALIGLIVVAVFSAGNVYFQGKELITRNRNLAFAGFEELQEGGQYLAEKNYGQANLVFSKAQRSLRELSGSTHYLTAQANVFLNQSLYLDTAEKLIESGIAVSHMGQQLADLAQGVGNLKTAFIRQNPAANFMTLLHQEKTKLDHLLAEAEGVRQNLATLNAQLLPTDVRGQLVFAQNKLTEILTASREVEVYFQGALRLLGDRVPHDYLILLQNKNERRATGGFIGSVVLVTVNDGVITKMEPKDVYDIDGQLMENVPPPAGIDAVAEHWALRDANYSPDFPTSAQKIMWFLEHSRGPSVDTVIAVDQTVAEKLLELTGPLNVSGIQDLITSENLNALLSYSAETKMAGTQNPKQLLFDLMPPLKERIMNADHWPELLAATSDLILGRHIQMYSADEQVEALIGRLGMEGRVIAAIPKTDYLNVVSTSIGGNKSDQFITAVMNHRTEIGQEGSLVDQLGITKNHTWQATSIDPWLSLIRRYGTGNLTPGTLRFILGEGSNVDYMRVYVPRGSRLTGSHNLESVTTYEDLGYTVFAFKMTVDPGKSETVSLKYELPFRLTFNPVDDYRLMVQKQAGTENITLKKTVVTADALEVVREYPEYESAFSLTPVYEMPLHRNQIFLTAVKSDL